MVFESIMEFSKKILTKIFGAKPTVSNTDSNGNTNLSGNNSNNNNTNNSNNNNYINNYNSTTNNTKKTELETKKEILTYKNNLYEHMLSYKKHIYGVSVLKLIDLDLDQNFSENIKELEAKINIEIDLLKEHYPDLCELARQAVDSISSYRFRAIPYGILKKEFVVENQKKLNKEEYNKEEYNRLNKLYNQRSSEIVPYTYKVEDTFSEYMNANRQ